jgi:hypothetical protein
LLRVQIYPAEGDFFRCGIRLGDHDRDIDHDRRKVIVDHD